MEFRICGKKFRFAAGRVEYYYNNKWHDIGKAKALKQAIEHAKYYAICTMY